MIPKFKWKLNSKVLIVSTLSLLMLVGIIFRIYSNIAARDQLASMYPKLEKLVAIYSLVGWRKPEQHPPLIKEDSEWGGNEFQLQCKNIIWGKGNIPDPGELFSCLIEPVEKITHIDSETIMAPQLNDSGDYWYSFSWETLFGYEMEVSISGDTSTDKTRTALQKKINEDRTNCANELGRQQPCSFTTYYVTMKGLTHSGSVSFLVSEGYPSWLSNGTVKPRYEWVIYIDDDEEPITVSSLNKFIQLTARQMQIKDTDLAKVAPELEAMWMNKDRVFIDGLFAEIEKAQDLMKFSGYLKTP